MASITAPEARAASSSGFTPHVPDDTTMKEFTFQAVAVGALLGILFGASSLYLVLRVGMTVSASIPVAVLSITLFRALSRAFRLRGATILENNITQTAGSAGESIAFGVGVTMPALMLLGFDMDLTRVMVVSILGGLLGILMMIPLRRAFIVNMHGKPGQPDTLLYPEGTACAQVLITGEKGGTSAATVFVGFGIAFVAKFLTEGMSVLAGMVSLPLKFFQRAAFLTTEVAPELIGVGYVIGVRVACVMMAGAVIGNLVLVPAIAPFVDPGPDKQSGFELLGFVQVNYLRYIGAGCVTAAGIISMFKTMPMIIRSFRSSLSRIGNVQMGGTRRTDRDMSVFSLIFGSLALLGLLAWFLGHELAQEGQTGYVWKALLGAALVLGFGFLFVTVSSRLTGEIGSSSNPISGMTVSTLALTCLIFLALGMTSPAESVLALSIGAVVCIASSNGGTTSQDLKTGFLVGGTPIYQQWAILIGALSSALVIGFILLIFNQVGTVVTSNKEFIPEVTLSPAQYEALTERVTYQGTEYRVWRARPGNAENAKPGKYYVDESRRVVFLEDPAITGRVKQRDNGEEVKMKFDAPKTAVIGIIINGVLEQKLNWGLVLIGAMLAVGLELCGVGSLAFAVGVYIPMQYTFPIFLGGITRWLVERSSKPSTTTQDEASAIAETETGPGVLLSSGYIAGGTIAGVLIAFLELPFFESIKEAISMSVKVEDKNLPRLMYELPSWGIDLAPLPLLLFLLAFLALVGMGKLFQPSRFNGS